jgi:hippurate hydrolase
MIKEGCLTDVDEVYGFHNIPNFDEGDIRVVHGPVMAGSTTFKMRIHAVGGHGSSPHLCNDVITAAA